MPPFRQVHQSFLFNWRYEKFFAEENDCKKKGPWTFETWNVGISINFKKRDPEIWLSFRNLATSFAAGD
jgi:hypothetical protein